MVLKNKENDIVSALKFSIKFLVFPQGAADKI